MKKLSELLRDCTPHVEAWFPWDAHAYLAQHEILVVDVREPYEYAAMHIAGSLLVPRGVLESAVEYGYEETEPTLVNARQQAVLLVCRSGNRSLLAANTLKTLGFMRPISLKTGLRGWNDAELALVDAAGAAVSLEQADAYFTPKLRPDQMLPK
jgi:rhodanese-related sulfurtransferase